MFRKSLMAVALAALAAPAWAAVSADEAKQLGTTLTALGAEKAGNKDGTIPEYTGGIKPPADFKPGSTVRPDPFASEKPRLVITGRDLAAQGDKRTQWAAFLRKIQVTDVPADLSTQVAMLRLFLAPVLAALVDGVGRLAKLGPSTDNTGPGRNMLYYDYYATQVMHHLGGEAWRKWNFEMRNTLLAMQETEGHKSGSWAPRGGAIGHHDTQTGGRIYMTSLAICTLEVYYRHLPIYRAIKDAK